MDFYTFYTSGNRKEYFTEEFTKFTTSPELCLYTTW